MPSDLILAIDQGTTNTKALLLNRSGAPVFLASAPVGLIQSELGHVEQDPEQIWKSVRRVIAESALYASKNGNSIVALALSNQRETATAWDAASGAAASNAISWQCPRSAKICGRLAAHAGLIRARTGLPLATLTSAGKWAWLMENASNVLTLANARALRFGTVDSWLVHKLTAGAVHATDFSNASRTGLLNLEALAWDTDLLDLFGLPLHAMPELRSSSGSFGVCSNVPGLDGVPILAAIGDSHAAMFGHGHFAPGTVKATYGTGSSLMALTPGLPADTPALARTIAWSIAGQTQFALEGNIAMTGSAVQWVGEFLGLADPSGEAAELAASVGDAGGVYFVPAMVGLGAPYWDAAARGTITGLSRSHTSAHLARAAIEAIAYQVADVFYAMEEVSQTSSSALYVDGGATRNSQLMQFQADMIGRPVLRSGTAELSALGASLLAGLALEWWNSLAQIAELPQTVGRFAPAIADDDRKCLYAGWKTAVRRALLNPEAGV
jgi:glycerol kinase